MPRPALQKILISRTDAIGDVCLTLPVCIDLKAHFPNVQLVYLCRQYTQAVVACFEPIDEVLLFEELETLDRTARNEKLNGISAVLHLFPNKLVASWCKEAGIALRVGTAHRLFHWWTCNLLPNFSRRHSDLHEAQLNYYLAKAIGLQSIPTRKDIASTISFKPATDLPAALQAQDFSNVVLLHPKSNGSGVEYPLEKYIELAKALVQKGYRIYFTGTEKEGLLFREQIPKEAHIFDATGLWDLPTFIAIIAKAKALVACSTGPYHLAGLTQIKAIGLFAQRKPIHPGRWAALGAHSVALTFGQPCQDCAEGKPCSCIEKIEILDVIAAIES